MPPTVDRYNKIANTGAFVRLIEDENSIYSEISRIEALPVKKPRGGCTHEGEIPTGTVGDHTARITEPMWPLDRPARSKPC